MRHIRFRALLFAFLALLVPGVMFTPTAVAYNNPPLEWRTIKTEHFEVHYHEGAEWTARQVAMVAEEVHGPLISLYGHEPDLPVHFIIKDTHDYANAAAYFFDNKVEIWATNLDFGYRGTTQWIRNVVTHEYAHIVSIQAAMKMSRYVPAIYFQLINFESEKRPDVLLGYPKDIVSYPISGIVFPPWFAEGVAQYQTPSKKYDCWDTHRDMILRSAVLEDKMLTYDEMGFFGKSSMRGEQVYDHGFALTNYIASQYGPDAIGEITRALSAPLRFTMDGALEKGTGKKGKVLYDEWKAHLTDQYEDQTADIKDNLRTGAALIEAGEKNGFMNVGPVFSPDGKKIAFLSNRGSDYAGTNLYLMDRDGKNRKLVKGGVSSVPVFSSDGKTLLYSRKHKVDKYGSTVNDVFVYDIDTKKEKRLTKASRIRNPCFSLDEKEIIGVKNSDGTHRIVIMNADGEDERVLFSGPMGTQFYDPRFSPDGDRILFGIFEKGTRDVAVISTDGTEFRYLLETPNDERCVRWTPDGKGILFSCDRTGIFNVYELDLESGWLKRHTNVIGGAFMPDLGEDGAIVYSLYGGSGYGINFVHANTEAYETLDLNTFETRDVKPYDECAFLKSPEVSASPDSFGNVAVFPDTSLTGTLESPASSKYKSRYTSFQFFPRVVVWDGKPRFGLFMTSNEILDKQALFVGGAYGVDNEYDLYLLWEARNFYPTIFADFIVMRQLYSNEIFDEDTGSNFFFNTRYNVWQADIGLKFELSDRYSLTHYHQIDAYWSHGEYKVNVKGDEINKYGEYAGSFNGGWKYYIGNEGTLQWTFRTLSPAVDVDINPRGGRQLTFQYVIAFDKLFTNGEFEYGFKPVFEDNNFNKFSLDWREYVGLPFLGHSLRLRLFASVIDRATDDFFWTYLGGRDGIRGYTFYSIGGRKAVLGSLTYRFPIFRNMNTQLFSLYFRNLYGSVFYETANAWSEHGLATEGYKNSAGLELRLSLGSYYVFPTAISWVSAYSIDPVENVLLGFTPPVVIRQERGWSHYFTLGFEFGL